MRPVKLLAWVCESCVFSKQFGLDVTVLHSLLKNAVWPRSAGLPSELAQIAPSTIGNPSLNGETILLYDGLRTPIL